MVLKGLICLTYLLYSHPLTFISLAAPPFPSSLLPSPPFPSISLNFLNLFPIPKTFPSFYPSPSFHMLYFLRCGLRQETVFFFSNRYVFVDKALITGKGWKFIYLVKFLFYVGRALIIETRELRMYFSF